MARNITEMETEICLLRASIYKVLPADKYRDVALMALALVEDTTDVDPKTAKMSERLDYLYNMVVQIDKQERASTPSPTYPV